MNKTVILKALERIELDADDPATVVREAAIIRCEMSDVVLPPLVKLDGTVAEFDPGKRYLVFLQAGSIDFRLLEDLPPLAKDVRFVIIQSSERPLRDVIHVVPVVGDTVVFVRPGTIETSFLLPGLRFVEVAGTGALADAVALRRDALAEALEICEDPMWADGIQIAERIRRL